MYWYITSMRKVEACSSDAKQYFQSDTTCPVAALPFAVRIFYERKLFMSLYIASLEFSLKHLSDKMQNAALANPA
ncbi:hypothetical protein MIZ03_3967 [Rhodoferax lithotrophicus]|uniref:Uncharacterized protein n=1 Tax=Rhodoferax lithotrophicus TaxID=2798804 RepID=A0ABM7MS24_9BURK|nr:hypothetical protein MIZ03_3967 [Rhodoferax sp. MIZ03]